MIDPSIASIIVALLINVPTWIMLRSNQRKSGSDAYSTLLDALQKSGQTIEDLFNMLAEVPQLRSELKAAQSDLASFRRQSAILVSFAREHWSGSRKLHAQVVRLHEDPDFIPAEKFITGPLVDGKS